MTGFDDIYRKHFTRLVRYAIKFVKREEDAINIVQDVFMAVCERKIPVENEQYVKSYLFNATRNHCLNFIKRERIRKRYEERIAMELCEMEIAYYSGEKSLIESETSINLHKAIDLLGDEYREVIILSRYEGLRNREIAEKLDIPLRSVETRLYRAISRLRELAGKQLQQLLTVICLKGKGAF
jgi:RNA polymerase sigma-70 factor (ECF subfamily)